MTDYRTELDTAITRAEDIECAVNAVGCAMEVGESAAIDYVGAIHVLARATDAHTRDLKALRLCMEWKDSDGTTAAHRKALHDLDAELLTARVNIERAETMLGEVCEEYFSLPGTHNPDTGKGQENILGGFNQNRVIAEIARDYAMQTRQTLEAMAPTLAKLYSAAVQS